MSEATTGQYQLIMPDGETHIITIEQFNDEYRAESGYLIGHGWTVAEALGQMVTLIASVADDDSDGAS